MHMHPKMQVDIYIYIYIYTNLWLGEYLNRFGIIVIEGRQFLSINHIHPPLSQIAHKYHALYSNQYSSIVTGVQTLLFCVLLAEI